MLEINPTNMNSDLAKEILAKLHSTEDVTVNKFLDVTRSVGISFKGAQSILRSMILIDVCRFWAKIGPARSSSLSWRLRFGARSTS